MREELLGYLLAALEPHEMRRVDARLKSDPFYREELADVQRMLEAVDRRVEQDGPIDVPEDLVERTMAMIPARPAVGLDAFDYDESQSPRQLRRRDTVGRLVPAPLENAVAGGRPAWADLVVGGLVAGVLLTVSLLGFARHRAEARSVVCQDHLRDLGTKLGQFVLRDRDSYLPRIAESGPKSFAGHFSIDLVAAGLLDDGKLLRCPAARTTLSDSLVDWVENADSEATASQRLTLWNGLVTPEMLQEAVDGESWALLKRYQQCAGGDYCFVFGVFENDRYHSPKYEARSFFAVMGDVPFAGTHVADRVDVSKMQWAHPDNAANMLFEDGSVRQLFPARMLSVIDHPYVNHRGAIEAGVNPDDAVLGASPRSPFIASRQR